MISESCLGNYRGNVRAWHQTITHHPLLLPPAREAIVIAIVIALYVIIIALFDIAIDIDQ